MFGLQQGLSKRKLIPKFIYKMVSQIKALSIEISNELKMKH